MGNKLLFSRRVLLFTTFSFYLSISIIYSQESHKALFEQASINLKHDNFKSATEQLKTLYQQNYCNKNAITVLISYTLAMDDKRPVASSYIERVNMDSLSDEIQGFVISLKSFIKDEGPNMNDSEYQSILDYINPSLPGESNRLLDHEKEKFVVHREYIRRCFESSSISAIQDQEGESDSGWGGEIVIPTQEELEAASQSEENVDGISEEEFQEIIDNAPWNNTSTITGSSEDNSVFGQLQKLFTNCE